LPVRSSRQNLIFKFLMAHLLCLFRLVNKIKPNTVTSIYDGPIAYKQMQNIEKYLTACSELGLAGSKFETNDLYNEKNLTLVLNNIHALAHTVQKWPSWKGPMIGDTTQSKSLFSATLVDGMSIDDSPAKADVRQRTYFATSFVLIANGTCCGSRPS